jgi:hypothetical protein
MAGRVPPSVVRPPGAVKRMPHVDTPSLEFSITPRDLAARHDLTQAQADILASLQGIAGVHWRYNDPGAQAVIISLPADQVSHARERLGARYMVDPNPGLQHL